MEVLPVFKALERDTVMMGPSQKCVSIDQIIMTVERLLETTCKWKEDHVVEAQEGINSVELAKRLSRVEEVLKKTRAEWDASLRANDEMG